MHPMATRRYTAGIIIFFGLALTLAPNETFARSGGSAGSGGSSAGSGASGGSSSSRSSRVQTSAVHTNEGRLRHHRRNGFFNPGFVYPVTVPTEVVHDDLPVENNPSPPAPVAPEIVPRRVNFVEVHMGCHTETVTVPWDNGKEHSVNIVRCYR
jgi:hypothetical protein